MLFNSQFFILVFLPLVLALYHALAGSRTARQIVVVCASLLFYGWWDVRFVPLLMGLTIANWLVAHAYGRWRHHAIPLLGVAMNLLVLTFFKYLNFLLSNLAWIADRSPPHFSVVLPLGLSFFTFQKISYLLDLRRGDRHQYGFLDFCMFVSFFPQLIAGPLVRHNEIIHQFADNPRRPDTWENLSRGAMLFLCGLIKKVSLADTAAIVCNPLFHAATQTAPDMAHGWAAALSYTLQIYFDFSGYSDMAIGIALMFGFCLPLNFDAPYRSVSVRDFWRRWHITLSRFLRDYLYIPLGGNRRGATRQVMNVIVTMLLGGLWHGANWTFVAWGGLHGLGLACNALWEKQRARLPTPLAWLLTMIFVVVGWVLFRSPDFGTAARMLAGMAGMHGVGHLHVRNLAVLIIAALLAVLGPTSQQLILRRLPPWPWLAIPSGIAFTYILFLIGGRIPDEFIYFQF